MATDDSPPRYSGEDTVPSLFMADQPGPGSDQRDNAPSGRASLSRKFSRRGSVISLEDTSSTEQKKDVEPSAFGDDSDSPRSLSEKETDRALKRWMDMPQMAIAEQKNHCATRVMSQLVDFYTAIHQEWLMAYHMVYSDVASFIDNVEAFFDTATAGERFFQGVYSKNENMTRMGRMVVTSAIAAYMQQNDTKVHEEEEDDITIRHLRHIVQSATEAVTLLPEWCIKFFKLLQIRLLEKYSRRSRLIGHFICNLLVIGLLRHPELYNIDLSELLSAKDDLDDVRAFFTKMADRLSRLSRIGQCRAAAEGMTGESKLVISDMTELCAAIVMAEPDEEDEGGYLSLPPIDTVPRKLMEEIGQFLVSFRMFRSSLCQSHFSMRIPVSLWNADMMMEFAYASGFGECAEGFRAYSVNGFTVLDSENLKRSLPFIAKLGMRKKVAKQLTMIQDAYAFHMKQDYYLWTKSAISCWLYENGFHGYSQAFFDHRIDGRAMMSITREELRIIGVNDADDLSDMMEEILQTFPRPRLATPVVKSASARDVRSESEEMDISPVGSPLLQSSARSHTTENLL